MITEEEVLQRILDVHGTSASEKFVQEVFWRTYFKGWLEQHPSVWTSYQSDLVDLLRALDRDFVLNDKLKNAVTGKTGIDCFDYWVRELVEIGYLHNHARMWFASIWIYTLGLPWQLGADFFLQHLIDGDPASNTLGWRWVGVVSHWPGVRWLLDRLYLVFARNRLRLTGRAPKTCVAEASR